MSTFQVQRRPCGLRHRSGYACGLPLGHGGEHEAHTLDSDAPYRWPEETFERPCSRCGRVGRIGGDVVADPANTLGWVCKDGCADPDPYAEARREAFVRGAGTTGLVADRLRRDAVLIELSEHSAALAHQRVTRGRLSGIPVQAPAEVVERSASLGGLGPLFENGEA